MSEAKKNVKKLLDVMGAAKQRKPVRGMKAVLARNFYADGNLFIERFDALNETEGMIDTRYASKAVVDLSMSIECSLKSLIICLSKDGETPVALYNRLKSRQLGHNLDNLLQEAITRAKSRFKIPQHNQKVFSDLSQLGYIFSRYSQEVWTLGLRYPPTKIFTEDSFVENTVEDAQWRRMVRNEAVRLNNLANDCYNKYLRAHTILNGKKFNTHEKEIRKFISQI